MVGKGAEGRFRIRTLQYSIFWKKTQQFREKFSRFAALFKNLPRKITKIDVSN